MLLPLQFQDGLTYMDWTYPLTGLDLSQVWDPELWLQFKQAVVWNTPEVFWDKLWDRISYSKCHAQQLGCACSCSCWGPGGLKQM